MNKFGIYYPINEVAARLSKHPKTIKRMAERGEFGPVWKIAGDLTVSESGLLGFMDRHVADFSAAAREFRRQAFERQMASTRPAERGPFSNGVSARCEGELRRKLAQQNQPEQQDAV